MSHIATNPYSLTNKYAHLLVTLSVNKRLDEWVDEDHIDPERLQLPRKESKIGSLSKNSRQPSPVDIPTPTGSDSRKHGGLVGRKRKHESVEVY